VGGLGGQLSGSTRPLRAASAGGGPVHWYNLCPVQKTYDITKNPQDQGPQPLFVEYEWREIKHALGMPELNLNSEKGLLPLGIHYYSALTDSEAQTFKGDRSVSFQGLPDLGGVPDVLQLVVRPDDSYLGYLSELLYVPFGLAPLGVGGGKPD